MMRNRLSLPAWALACGVIAIVTAFSLPAAAQAVTSADIQRLQDQVYQASGDVSRLRSSNPDAASRLQSDLDDLRDDVVYLKVKLRREGTINRTEYTDVRDRLQDLRSKATADNRGDNQGWTTNSSSRTGAGTSTGNGGVSGGVSGGQSGDVRSPESTRSGTTDSRRPDQGTSSRSGSDQPTIPRPASNSVIPAGQELDVRLQNELSSATAQVEQRFEAVTVADLYQGNNVLIPAGSTVRGVVSGVTKTTRMERKGSLTVAFDQLTVNGRDYPMRGTVTQALESEGIRGEANKIGAGAGVGAIIGGIIGGVKGALLGVLIGGGGTVAATEGKDVTLPAGTILRVRLDTPPAVR
jgi:hypothetical protein